MPNIIAKFGFEIEGEFTPRLRSELKQYGTFVDDGSIENCRRCYEQGLDRYEFVSKVFEDRTEAEKVFTILHDAYTKKEFHFNNSQGFHIHLSFTDGKLVPEFYDRAFTNFFKEKALAAFPDAVRERLQNTYCQDIQDESELKRRHNNQSPYSNRYRFINLWPAWQKHKTIEVRLWPSDEPKTMLKYLKFTLEKFTQYFEHPLVVSNAIALAPDTLLKRKFVPKLVSQIANASLFDRTINETYINITDFSPHISNSWNESCRTVDMRIYEFETTTRHTISPASF